VAGISIERYPLHLGLGATAEPQPEFTGEMEWYMDYSERNAADGAEGRLVTTCTFTEDWASWEVHPAGDEVVLCLSGEMTLHQQFPDGRTSKVTIGAGEYAINPPGVWHTADIAAEATALFITAGEGTENRPR
jgi:mannose-6-phosphate isomerase-like protein (cupin superfamily)